MTKMRYAVAAGIALLTMGAPLAASAAPSAGDPAAAAAAPSAAQPAVGPTDELEASAQARFGAAFGGVAVDEAGRLTVVVKGNAAVDGSAFRGASVKRGTHSLAELKGQQMALSRQVDALSRKGVTLGAWGVDVLNNRLFVRAVLGDGVSVADAKGRVSAALGSDVDLQQVTALPEATSRNNDGAPHWGGARILSSTAGCTSGFYWTTGAILTAGHCGSVGSQWYSTVFYGGMNYNGLNTANPNRRDFAAIAPSGGGQGYIYNGVVNSNTFYHVGFYWPGSQAGVTGIRTSGSYGGEVQVGNGAVTAVDISVNYGGSVGVVNHLNQAVCRSIPGDSGGPVFTLQNGQAVAAGIISGRQGDTICFYTPVNQISAQYGGVPAG